LICVDLHRSIAIMDFNTWVMQTLLKLLFWHYMDLYIKLKKYITCMHIWWKQQI